MARTRRSWSRSIPRYSDLREQAGRTDRGALAATVLAALRGGSEQPARPVFVYGFDDLTLIQRELLAELARTADVTMAVNYADRRSLAARATLVGELREELGAEIEATLESEPAYTRHASLRHLDASLFEPDPGTVPIDDGVALLECAGERGEAEAIGLEIARLLAEGVEPGDIAVVDPQPVRVRPRAGAGPGRLRRAGCPRSPCARGPHRGGPGVGLALPRRRPRRDRRGPPRPPALRPRLPLRGRRPRGGAHPPRRGHQRRRRVRELGAPAPAPRPGARCLRRRRPAPGARRRRARSRRVGAPRAGAAGGAIGRWRRRHAAPDRAARRRGRRRAAERARRRWASCRAAPSRASPTRSRRWREPRCPPGAAPRTGAYGS